MSTVVEIESAIRQLPRNEFWKLADWFDSERQATWEEQMAADADKGKLDFLFEEAAQARQADTLKPWPAQA